MLFKVNNINTKTRLDAYIVNLLQKPRNYVDKLFDKKLVFINNEVVIKKGLWIQNGDAIEIKESMIKQKNELSIFKSKIKIVYEDEDIIVVDKPKHVLVHPTTFNEQNTLVNILLNKILIHEFSDPLRPGVVHRLDRDTSGLVIFAKHKKSYDALIKQIVNRILIRKYIALVHNAFNDKFLLIKVPITRSKQNELRMVASDDTKAKLAQTEVLVLENYHKAALVECRLLTGRTHQIRVHMSYIHHPIFNDPIYGNNDGYTNYGQFLHAHFMSFVHPITNKPIVLQSKPDKIFLTLQKKLKDEK